MEVLDHGRGFFAKAVAVRNPRVLSASLDDLRSETGTRIASRGVFAATVLHGHGHGHGIRPAMRGLREDWCARPLRRPEATS